MDYMKFECPSCGQNLECDRAFGGDVIHCPRCCAEIRVPFGSDLQIEGSVSKAELISQPATAPPSPSQPVKNANEQVKQSPPTPPAQPKEVKCPVCQAELRIAAGLLPKASETLPVAELIRKGPDRTPKMPTQSQTEFAHLPIEEREQKIAAARKDHPVQVNTPMKPRLEYVLSGEAPPANVDSTLKPPQPPEPAPDNSDTKSFNE